MTGSARVDRGLRVGVTMFIRGGDQSLWENGIHQNANFLMLLLMRSPIVSQCFVVNGAPKALHKGGNFEAELLCPVIDMVEAMNTLDVVIELGAHLKDGWTAQFRARGGRIIAMRVANDYVIDMESMANTLPPGQLVYGIEYDQIWTLPAFERTNTAYYANLLRAPVRTMTHLWSPLLIERDAQATGRPWGYKPDGAPWRIAIMEPNRCSVKTCHVPMLICEEVYRRQPQVLAAMQVFNADLFRREGYFAHFAAALDVVRSGLVTFRPRYKISRIMHDLAHCIVSHHVDNAQNYLYYEALHGGFPLIHNSALLADCGYRYRDLDCEDGARALLAAMACHEAELDGYRARSRAFLKTLDPCGEANVAQYSAAIRDCFVDR